jgi:hypothetical protein
MTAEIGASAFGWIVGQQALGIAASSILAAMGVRSQFESIDEQWCAAA